MIPIIEVLVANPFFTLIGTLASIVGLVLTVFVTLKTKSISKQLNEIRTKQEYSKKQRIYVSKFNAYIKNILDDEIKRPSFYKNILKDVAECKIQFKDLFSISDKLLIWRILFHLQKEPHKINTNQLANDLGYLTARLTKKEDISL